MAKMAKSPGNSFPGKKATPITGQQLKSPSHQAKGRPARSRGGYKTPKRSG